MRRLMRVAAVILVVGFALGSLALFAGEIKQETAKPGAKQTKVSMDVKKLQEGLQKLGYEPGAVDGILGSKTRAAVKAFQQDNGLKADGKAGKATMAKLEALLKAKQ